ncbi:MAG: outer membrane protein [Hyphomicrobiaceae bacterium]
MYKSLKRIAGVAVLGATLGIVAPANAQNWSGIYIGANAGWADKSYDWAFNPALPAADNQAYSLSNSDGIVGGHVGIQQQWGQFLLGIEAAYSGSGAFDDDWTSRPRFGVGTADSLVKVGPIFTVGPRIGWAVSNQWLLFAGGGYATANIHSTGRDSTTSALIPALEGGARHEGWYAGGGVEFALTRHIILGAEYQRVELGTERHNVYPYSPTNTNNRDIDASIDIIRARLSFKIGRDDTRVEPLK